MLTRNTVVLAKKEATYGVDPIPTETKDALLVTNPSVKMDGELLTRDYIRSTLSPVGHTVGRKKVTVSFDTELKGSGIADVPPESGVLFQGCGMLEQIPTIIPAVSYRPISSNQSSITLYVYFDGLLHKVTGTRGSFSLNASAGQFAKVSWTFEGKYHTPEDAALPTNPVFDSTSPPVVVSANFTADSISATVNSLAFDMANTIAASGDMNSADGYGEFMIVGRDPNGSFDPEATTRLTQDFWADWESATEKYLNMFWGKTVGNRCEFKFNNAIYREIGYGDREGVRTYEVPFTAAGSSIGDDELMIAFG